MYKKYLSRRLFLNYVKLSFIFLLSSCSKISKKIKISFQSSFYPESFKETLPATWHKEKISFGKLRSEKKTKLINTDFFLINDGWINNINFEKFQNINYLFPNKFDNRSRSYLNSFEEYQSNKLLPIGLVPFAVIIKNNQELINLARQSWDFLLSKKLKGKIIFPQSPRIIMSISRKINVRDSLRKLKEQAMLFEDQNSLNWLINSNASVAIVPYYLCLKYLRFDTRLSMIFPEKGVPLVWNFLLSNSKTNNKILIDWIQSLDDKKTIDKLANEGWYLPFKNEYAQSKYNIENEKNNLGPSKKCWENSWSFSPLNNEEKLNLENSWNESSTP